MKPRRKKPRARTANPVGPRNDRHRSVEELERDFAQKVAAWAKLWERCPLPGCRRNARCLHEEACRACSGEVTEKDRQWIGEQFRAFWETIDEPEPKYDGVKVR